MTAFSSQIIDKTIGLRLSEYDELIGSDFIEHKIAQHLELALPPEIKVHSSNNNLQPENGVMASPNSVRKRRSSFGFRTNVIENEIPQQRRVKSRSAYGMRSEVGKSNMSISTVTSLSDINPV